jgi:hypothetical protein
MTFVGCVFLCEDVRPAEVGSAHTVDSVVCSDVVFLTMMAGRRAHSLVWVSNHSEGPCV